MRCRALLTVVATILHALSGSSVSAQHMYLDTNEDGRSTATDAISERGGTFVDVWLQTDAGRDGTPTALRDEAGNKPSINSYTFIIRASGGVVRWGKFDNFQTTMIYPFGPRQNATDYYHGFGGSEYLPAGKVRLGRLHITVESGTPRLEIVSKSSLWDGARTSFGSRCVGADFDNTLKLAGTGAAAEPVGRKGQGDWNDATGVGAREAAVASDAIRGAATDLRFGVRVVQSSSAGGPSILLTTTRGGFARIRLFDVSGRLVRTLLNEPFVNVGKHTARITATPTASGVYFYKVETPEGSRSGRVVLLRE